VEHNADLRITTKKRALDPLALDNGKVEKPSKINKAFADTYHFYFAKPTVTYNIKLPATFSK
jgi:hypothetical protein